MDKKATLPKHQRDRVKLTSLKKSRKNERSERLEKRKKKEKEKEMKLTIHPLKKSVFFFFFSYCCYSIAKLG